MKSLETWTPVALDAGDNTGLSEAAERVLAQVDGNTPVADISSRTGMDMADVLVAMGDLVRRGALDSADAPPEVVQLAHVRIHAPTVPQLDVVEAVDDGPEMESFDSLPELEVLGAPTDEDLSELPELELLASDPEGRPPDEQAAIAAGSYRQVFETTLRPLPVDVRVQWAHTGEGDVLCALCMDPMPGVVQAVLENPNANLIHARLIAEHHRNPIGLDGLGHRAEFVADSTVRRFLLRNQQASERLLLRMLSALPLTQVFRANVGHELTDRARRAGRTVLRRKFDQSQAEEKIGLIVQTEGRCLASLVGITFDQKTTALLCRRTYQSTMLIQSLARFPASPPALISHLLRQQVVVRNAHLKKRLQQHPNCPKSLKR